MTSSTVFYTLFIPILVQISLCLSIPEGMNYYVEAFQQEGDPEALILKLRPVLQENSSAISPSFQILHTNVIRRQQARQQEEEEDEDDVPSTTPYIPQIIPGLTKIFNGLVTGNLNEIFHGSTSFAPKNVSYAIDTVYNQVVGIPPPKTKAPTMRTTTTVPVVVAAVAPASANATAKPVAVTAVTTPVTIDEDEDGTDIDSETDTARKGVRRGQEGPPKWGRRSRM